MKDNYTLNIQSYLELSDIEPDEQCVLLLDEMQRFRTIDENGKLVGPFADWAVKEKDGSISSNFGNEESKQKIICTVGSSQIKIIHSTNLLLE